MQTAKYMNQENTKSRTTLLKSGVWCIITLFESIVNNKAVKKVYTTLVNNISFGKN